MKISYPLRDTNGKELCALDDVMRLIDGGSARDMAAGREWPRGTAGSISAMSLILSRR